jgi:hypothetical protein
MFLKHPQNIGSCENFFIYFYLLFRGEIASKNTCNLIVYRYVQLTLKGVAKLIVRELIKAIVSKEIKISELASKYGFSDRTIQSKIKGLGFEWDAKEAVYVFKGTDETVYDLPIDEVFKKAVRGTGEARKAKSKNTNKIASKNAVKKDIKKASEEIAVTVQDTIKDTPETDSNKASNSTSKKRGKKAIDNIDRLLAGKKAKKEYMGFYLDSDIAGIIASVDSGIKSALVNECLRKVFKEKGLL